MPREKLGILPPRLTSELVWKVGIEAVSDKTWLVTFMHYDLGFFDHEACRLQPLANPFEPKVLSMSPV